LWEDRGARPIGTKWSAIGFAGLVLVTTLAAGRADAAVTLAPSAASPFAVGASPKGIATADFNNDGKQDIAIANSGNNNVTILLGNGTGGFAASTGSPFAAGSTPMAVVVKDFNKDGKMDLAVMNQQSNNVTILLGDGLGGFTAAPGSPYAVGANPNFAATGDFNGDTNPDLAVSNSGSNTVTLLLGNGAGGFTQSAGSPFATGPSPQGIVAADFNTDGKLDIAVADGSDGNVTYLFGDGLGGFSLTSHAQGCNPGAASFCSLYGMVAGNFYNHTYTDLVTVASGINEINILRGFGNGTDSYNQQFFPSYSLVTAATGDFDSDGNLDVAVVSGGNLPSVLLVLGNGNGGFNVHTEPYYSTGNGPYGVVAADFNGDGKPDVVVTNSTDNTITILLSPGAPIVPPVVPPPAVTQVEQTISFTVTNHLASDAPFALQATASSGLPVTFRVISGPATLSGNMLTLTGIGAVTVEATQTGSSEFLPATTDQSFTVALGAPAITSIVNGASFVAGAVVPTNFYATIFGNNLAGASARGDATSSQILGGTNVTIVDSAKSTFTANLYLVSFGQINLVVPAKPAAGAATVVVTNATGKSASFAITIGAIAPGLFSADGTGAGLALGNILVIGKAKDQTIQPTAVETPFGAIGVPIPLSADSLVYLILAGTGIRGRSGLAGVVLTIGGTPVPVIYAGPQGSFPGLDQIDVPIPASFAGAGIVKVQIAVDGIPSNTVTLSFR